MKSKPFRLSGARLREALDVEAMRFSYSLHVDYRLASFDVKTNQAHAKALHKAGFLSAVELKRLVAALTQAGKRLEKEDIRLLPDEDVHSCLERFVTEELGDLGKKLHTGKSRNDQVITDVRQWLKEALNQIQSELALLVEGLVRLAENHQEWIFPGFTHFQPAQPVLLAHHLLAYVEQFLRDKKRFAQAFESTDVCPLGSGALAGNNYGLDRAFVAKELGFSRITQNSMDAVSDRDFMIEALSAASLCMVHLSRFSEEIILWSSPILGFVSVGDSFTTGSSLMPQKKNPDIAELIRGKTGRVTGNHMALLQILKALPLTYNRDLQEDKELLFDSMDTVRDSLLCFRKMIGTLTFHRDGIETAVQKGYMVATELADYLVGKGIPFREAHELTGQIVLKALDQKKSLEGMTLKEFRQFSDRIDQDIYIALAPLTAVDAKQVVGGTARKQVAFQLKRIKKELSRSKEHGA